MQYVVKLLGSGKTISFDTVNVVWMVKLILLEEVMTLFKTYRN